MTAEHPLTSLLRVVSITHPNTVVTFYGTGEDWYVSGRVVLVSECGRVVQILDDDGDLCTLNADSIIRIIYRVSGTSNFDEDEDVAVDAIKQEHVKLAKKAGLVHDAKLYKPQRVVTKRKR